MKTAHAVMHVLISHRLTKYALAKSLGMSTATSVNQWLGNTRMSTATAKKFKELYDIEIEDQYETL